MSVRYQNRDRILRSVTQHLVDHPFEQLSLNGIARASGVSLWALRYNYDNPDRLFRAVGLRLVERVVQELDGKPAPSTGALDAITDYARFLAACVTGKEYRDLLYFVLRNGQHHRWICSSYKEAIVEKVCADLEASVRQSGESQGRTILLKEGAARRFHRRIESELALAALLPSPANEEPPETERLLRDIVREAFEATYVFEWVSDTRHRAIDGRNRRPSTTPSNSPSRWAMDSRVPTAARARRTPDGTSPI